MPRPAPLLLFVLLFPAVLFAQRQVDIGGRVVYADTGRPASDITVSVLSTSLAPVLSDTTSRTGEFRFMNLQKTQYVVSVQVPGYEPIELRVDLEFEVVNMLQLTLKPLVKKDNPESPHQPTVSAHELSMPSKAREALASGNKKLYQDKDAQGSLADYQLALSVAPTYFEASYQLGIAYLTLGKASEAEVAFRQSITSSGDTYAPADAHLGSLFTDRSDLPQAEKLIRKGISLDPNFWLGHYELGRLLLNQEQLSEALASAEEARRLAPNVPIVYRLLSNIHLQQKNYPALLADLNSYIALDPDSPIGARAKRLRDQIQQNHSVEVQHFAVPSP